MLISERVNELLFEELSTGEKAAGVTGVGALTGAAIGAKKASKAIDKQNMKAKVSKVFKDKAGSVLDKPIEGSKKRKMLRKATSKGMKRGAVAGLAAYGTYKGIKALKNRKKDKE